MRSFRLVFYGLAVCLALTGTRAADPKDLVAIPQSAQQTLTERGIPVTYKAAAYFLAEWTEAEQEAMRETGIPFQVIRRDITPDVVLYMFELHDGEDPPLSWRPLYRSGRNVILEMSDADAAKEALEGQHPVRLWHEPLGWGPPRTSQLTAYDCSFKPLIGELIGKSSQAQWTDWIEKLSGVETVDIGGTAYQINTRFTSTMFSGATNAKGYDFVRQQAQAWGFTGTNFEEDPFTFGTSPPINAKNLVLTIPGQNSTTQVLLTAHLDSIWQGGSSSTSAPGANDNGTGSATLLEALRILRQYRFDRTIKIAFWTGEEQGLFGSAAYAADHGVSQCPNPPDPLPPSCIHGVLNLDMFGYDANNDRCMEIHVGTLAASGDVGTCFNTSILQYGMGLSRDYLTSGATDRSDHASFWQRGIGAIEIAENFFNNSQAGGCVGSEPNPNYHTNNDGLANNMHPSYAHSIAKTALATISAMAIPLNACFSAAPALTAANGPNQIELSWTAVPGAASYRIYRAANGCGGNFVSIGETAGTTFTDPVPPATFSYKIEAVTADGLCFSAESNCSSAAPNFFHATPSGAAFVDVCPSGGPGSGDGYLDPGEIVTMPVTLQNDGNMPLTAITGTLTSANPEISILVPSADWPDLAASTSSQTLPEHFRFQVGEDAACGAEFALNVQATAAEGAWTGSFLKNVGLVIPGNATVLDENFAAGIPATWTVVDGGTPPPPGGGPAGTWTTANPGGRTFTAPLVAPVAIVDSDEASTTNTQDEQLITPVLDLSTAQTVTLQFDQYFQWYSGGLNEIGDVDVRSSLTGNAWVNVFRNQGANSPNPDHKTLNITAQAAGAADVQIRFHYYNGAFEWWWMVDNVRVDVTAQAGCLSNPCAAGAAARPVPQMTASRVDDTTLDLSWSGACASADHEILYGDLATVASYALGGAVCGIGTAGATTWSGVPAGDLWFLVTGVNGTGTEASWGQATGGPRNGATASAQCGNASRDNGPTCP